VTVAQQQHLVFYLTEQLLKSTSFALASLFDQDNNSVAVQNFTEYKKSLDDRKQIKKRIERSVGLARAKACG